jgi:tetraacyldisaccharide 4'-kinase
MQRRLESYFLNVITGKQRGISAAFVRSGLFLLSWPFRVIVAGRNWIFDQGWVSRYSPPVPYVISIGNIVVGGTGKTPVTLMFAKEFYDEFFIGILSRGYRSLAEKLPIPVVLSKGEGPMQSASFCGDEPFLLAQNLPKAFVVVGRDRHKASDIAARAGVQLILLDDGMQHRRLARDFEIVVMDTRDLFGQGYYLPRGFLREGMKSLSRADLIILNHVKDKASFEQTKAEVAKYSEAIVVGTRMEVLKMETVSGEVVPCINGKKVGIFCGIAHPEYFQATVTQEGAEIVGSEFTSDHISPDFQILAAFAEHCKAEGAEMLLCTEKDKVKITDLSKLALPIVWLKMQLKLVEGENEWTSFIEGIKNFFLVLFFYPSII